MVHARGRKSKVSSRFSGLDLRLESLEDRHLLAADLLSEIHISDPYARDAVTVAQMEARAQVEPYVEGELMVALVVDSVNRLGPHRPLSSYLQTEQFSTSNFTGLKSILSSQQSDATTFTLVKVDLAGVDVIAAMRQLDAAANVLWTSPNFVFAGDDARDLIPNDPQYGSQYHHPLEQNDDAWDITLGSSDIVIGVTDDGVDLQHQDLATGIWVNAGEVPGNNIDDDGNGYIDDVNGYNFLNHNNNPDALAGDSHGTHVSGIAAARTNNGIGVSGVAGDSTILPLKWYDGGTWTAAIIAETFTYAADNGANIVNTSYNMDGWANNAVVHAAFRYMYDAGILHFNSAGNSGALNPPRQVFEQTLLVASTESNDAKSSFSNYGTGVDISAAGGSILSSTPNNTYSVFSGTSMATPNAAGVAALIWAQNPTWSREQVAAQLLATADNIDAQNPGLVGLLGGGRVNSFQALTQTIAAPKIKSLVGIPNGGSVPASTVITEFEVRFDQVMDSASVTAATSYDLRSPGLDNVFDTADDEVFPLTVTSPYYYGTNSINVDIAGGALGIGDYRLTVQSGGVENPFGTDLDGNGDTVPGDDYVNTFSITMNGFQRVGVGGGLSKLSSANPGVLSGSSDIDSYDFFAEAGETVTAVITPTSGTVTLSGSFVGGGSATAAGPGQSVVVPLSSVITAGDQTLLVDGDGVTAYTFSIYRNVNIEGLNESASATAIDDSYLALGSGRYAAIGQSTTGDVDLFSVDLTSAAGNSIDVVLGSTTGQSLSTFSMELLDPSNAVVATATPNFGGGPITNYSLGIHDFVPAAGTYTVRISANQSATYSLLVTDDLVFDTEPNDATARSLNNVNGALGLMTSGSLGLTHYNNVGLFVDISGTGTGLGLTDDGEATITTTVGNDVLAAGNVTVGNNGLIAVGANLQVPYTNVALPNSDFGAALAPFWDDVDADTGNVYWEERMVGGINTLIVQWDNRPHFSNVGSGTFQVQIFESGPIAARFVYPDVDFGNASFNGGASATIGAQLSSTEGVMFSFNTASLANGDVIDVRTVEVDRYSVTLASGESVQLRTETPFDDAANLPPNVLDPNLTVRDSTGVILASDSNSAGDGKNALINFTASSAGTYFIDVASDGGAGEYLLVKGGSTIDGDFNDDGLYDCVDIDLLTGAVIQGTDLNFDLNGDGQLTLADRDAWLGEAGLANGLPSAYIVGDIDLNGDVDGFDFIVWNQHKFTLTGAYCSGDINMDGQTDGLDFIEWNAHKFTSSDGPTAITRLDKVQNDAVRQTTGAHTVALPLADDQTRTAVPAAPTAVRTQAVERLFAAYGHSNRRAQATSDSVSDLAENGLRFRLG